jgi:hypothetical protein
MSAISPTVRRRLVGAAIVAFWLVMVGALVERQLKGRPAVGKAAAARAGERWFAVETAGRRIGTLHLASGPEARDGRSGSALRLDAGLHVRVLDTPTELEVAGTLWRARSSADGAVELDVRSGEHAVRIEGKVRDGLFRGTLVTAGTILPLRARVGALPSDETALLGLPAGVRLAPGREVTFETLDPFTLTPAPARARLVREETLAVEGRRVAARVVEVTVGTATVTAWLDASGEVVQADVPFGIRLRRISRADAASAVDVRELPDLAAALDVVPTGTTPRRGARRMVVRVGGVPLRSFPTDDTQAPDAGGASLVVTAPGADEIRHLAPPHASDPAAAEYLRCDALVQCDQPPIRDLAAAIVRGETDPWRRAVLIERWVHDHVVKKPVPALPSALDVLATREGDCTEHTVLFTALARAAGIPTRMAAGLVWSDEVGAFAYHAWPEVDVGRWVWTDPTLGQDVADATHLKLASGGVADWRGTTAFLGRLRLTVESVE